MVMRTHRISKLVFDFLGGFVERSGFLERQTNALGDAHRRGERVLGLFSFDLGNS